MTTDTNDRVDREALAQRRQSLVDYQRDLRRATEESPEQEVRRIFGKSGSDQRTRADTLSLINYATLATRRADRIANIERQLAAVLAEVNQLETAIADRQVANATQS